MSITSPNPLSKHFRQPKIYIGLPSGGIFYPQGDLEPTETNEFPVYAMTAKDELMFKTPDALLNGQSTVNVIQSCIPNIKNAWSVPSVDIDAILVAIRIATYGEKMDIEIDVPGIDEPRAYEVDLRTVMDQLTSSHFENVIRLDDFSIEISPLTYKEFTEAAMKTFEEQRVFRIVNDTEMTESEKLSKFNESFNRLTDLNISSIVKSVKCVTFDNEEPVTNTQHIIEFFENADKDVFKKVIDHITAQKEKFSIKPFKVRLSEEDIAKGAPETMEIPISFDQSNFFA
jgi:hypothetical protein